MGPAMNCLVCGGPLVDLAGCAHCWAEADDERNRLRLDKLWLEALLRAQPKPKPVPPLLLSRGWAKWAVQAPNGLLLQADGSWVCFSADLALVDAPPPGEQPPDVSDLLATCQPWWPSREAVC